MGHRNEQPIVRRGGRNSFWFTSRVWSIGDLDKRIDDLRGEMSARFGEVNHRFDDLKDWIRSEVKRLEGRIDRNEHLTPT